MISIHIPSGWLSVTLDQVAVLDRSTVTPDKIQAGTTYVGLEHVDSDGQFLSPPTVQPGELSSNKFAFGPEHVLYGKLRPYLKKIALPSMSGICTTEIVPIRPGPKLNRQYLFYYLRQQRLIDFATERCGGANLPRLSPKLLAKFPIPLPPLPEQRRIAAILDKADAIRRKRQEAIELTEAFLQSAYIHTVGPKNPKYKKWADVKIEDLAVQKKGSIRSGPFGSALKHSEFVGEGIAVLGIDNAVQNRFAWGQRRYITKEKYDNGLKRYQVFPGDVIVTIMGTTGRSAVVPDDLPQAITTKHLATITLETKKALPEYVSHAIHRDPFLLKQVALRNRGAIMAGLNLGLIRELRLKVPPMSIQQKFNAQVRRIRSTESVLKKSSQEADNLFNSLVQRAFKGEL